MTSYIDEINAFWELQELNHLSMGQIALWFCLMDVNNKCAWNEWFTAASSRLVSMTGLARSSIYKDRNVLRQKGYIEFKETSKGSAAKYKMCSLLKHNMIGGQVSRQVSGQVGGQVSGQVSRPLNRLDKDLDKKESKKKKDGLEAAIDEFLEFRRKVKAPMTDKAIELMLSRLEQLSGGDEKKKIAILEQSILNGWKGVFALKPDAEEAKRNDDDSDVL